VYECMISIRDVHGNGIPKGTGNPMGMGIKHNWEWECEGMGIAHTGIPW